MSPAIWRINLVVHIKVGKHNKGIKRLIKDVPLGMPARKETDEKQWLEVQRLVRKYLNLSKEQYTTKVTKVEIELEDVIGHRNK